MKNLIIAAFVFVSLVGAAHAETYMKGYGKTVQEAFAAGVQLAERADAERGGGKDCLDAATRIHILPEKENGLFVVEVYISPYKGLCPLKNSGGAEDDSKNDATS